MEADHEYAQRPPFVATHSTATHRRLRIGIGLVVVTMVYNVIEACVGLWAGVEAESIARVGFGLDSIIELMAASFLDGFAIGQAFHAGAEIGWSSRWVLSLTNLRMERV